MPGKRISFAWLGPVAALLLAAGARAEEIPLVLLHTADLHGHVAHLIRSPGEEPNPAGWLRIASLIRSVRKENPDAILVDAGDTLQGTPESYATRGREMLAALERLSYDAWIIGNHEFDWGWETLRNRLDETRLTALGANLLGGRGGGSSPLPNLRPYTLVTVKTVRIAMVGLTTPRLPHWFIPELLGPVPVSNSIPTLRALFPALRAENPDVLVLVLHQGYRGNNTDLANEAGRILQEFPEFDVVIGGHTHEFIPGLLVNGVLYAQPGCHGAALGRIDLVYDTEQKRVTRKEGRLLQVGFDTPVDAEEAAAWAERLEETRANLAAPVGRLAAPLSPRSKGLGDSGIEQLLRAAIAEAVDADIVLHGVLSREALVDTIVTESDLWRIVPFENRIGVASLTFRELREILEEILAQPNSSRFMGVRGAIVHVQPEAPVGKRVVRLRKADGRAAHWRKRFRVAFNSYTLASAGGRFPRLRELALRPQARFELTSVDTREAVRTYLAAHPNPDFSGTPPDGYRLPENPTSASR